MGRVADRLLVYLIAVLGILPTAFSQTTTSEVSGTAVDPSGAVIRNVTSLGGEYA
jgi:hypothetical protein